MKYQIMMTGGKNIVIDQDTRDRIDQLLKGDDKWIEIGHDKFKASTVKGVFELQGDSDDRIKYFSSKNEQWNKEWSDDLFKIAKLTVEEKTKKELEKRLIPGLKLSKLHSMKKEVREAILNFFIKNPQYPRCPAFIWWPLIKDTLQTNIYISMWFKYVFRNDDAIADWAKFNKIKINI